MTPNSLCALLVALVISSCAPARNDSRPEPTEDETAVLAAVQKFFDTMNTRDAAGARAVLDPDGDFVSVRWTDDGQRIVRRSPNKDYLEDLDAEQETWVERMWDAKVLVRGPIAIVWTPYDFHVDGEFSHCGIDAFQLLKSESGWTITGGTYTVEPTGCVESPLGALADWSAANVDVNQFAGSSNP